MASATTSSEGKRSTQRRKSCDTVCSSNSSCFLHKRKAHPLAASIRTHIPRSNSTNNAVKQRVSSARLLKVRSLQNQLNDANFHLAELQQENRALRNLQSRQDRALSRYEGTSADLPKLLKTHEEDIRILTAKNKTLRKNLRDVSEQLKIKEEELLNVREQLRNLATIAKNKNLGERQALAEQVGELKEKLKNSENQVNLLNRKLALESKNYKFRLNTEVSKHKQTQKDLHNALTEIDKISSVLEGREKHLLANGRRRFATVNQRSSVSLINLSDNKPNRQENKIHELVESKVTFNEKLQNRLKENDVDNQSDCTDIKLEPIGSETKTSPMHDVMVSPSESIKARLSVNSIIGGKDDEELSKCIEKLQMLDSNFSDTSLTDFISIKSDENTLTSINMSESISVTTQHDMDKKASLVREKQKDINERLGKCCNEMLVTVQDCTAIVDKHQKDFEFAKSETAKLLESLRETDKLNSKLRYSNFLTAESIEIPEKDVEVANKIWKDEYMFREEMKHSKHNKNFINSDKNGNVIKKETNNVTQENKNKLLATLRAIDNGEEIEEINFNSNKENKLLEELLKDLQE